MSNPNRPEWRTLAEELAELECTDPAVKRAADELDRVTREIIEAAPGEPVPEKED